MKAEGLPRVVGLLCGSGDLPLRAAEALRAQGAQIVAIGIRGEAAPGVESVVDRFEWTSIARLGRWVKVFKAADVDVLLMVGGIRKAAMYEGASGLMPDWRSARLMYRRLRSKEDHTILGAVADEFEREGIRVGSVADYCPELLVRPGCLTRRRPTAEQWRDVRFAWPLVKQIAAMQIGQCIVVKDQSVVAVESMEGTDATLERGGELARGGAVAVKVPRPDHDRRFDIPCVGSVTVATLRRAGVIVLALEAGGTLMLGRDEVRRCADEADVCIIGVKAEDIDSDTPPDAGLLPG